MMMNLYNQSKNDKGVERKDNAGNPTQSVNLKRAATKLKIDFFIKVRQQYT